MFHIPSFPLPEALQQLRQLLAGVRRGLQQRRQRRHMAQLRGVAQMTFGELRGSGDFRVGLDFFAMEVMRRM